MKKFWIWIFVLVGLGAVGALVYDLVKPGTPNVTLEFSKPDSIQVGKPFALVVSYSNSSDQVLKDATFSILLPQEFAFLGRANDQRNMEESMGDIGPGSVNQQTINLVALGGEQSFKRVEAKIRYSLANSGQAQYETSRTADLNIGQDAVGVSIVTPENIANGENFDVAVQLQNNSGEDLKNLKLVMAYPPVFTFGKSSADGMTNNQELSIPLLPKGQSTALTITGTITGSDFSKYPFSATVSSIYSDQTYVLGNKSSEVALSPSMLGLSVKVNGVQLENYVAAPNDMLEYELDYKNNSSVPLSALRLTMVLTGTMFDLSTLEASGGLLNSLTNTITWTQQNAPDLVALNPGEEHSIKFRVRAKSDYPIRRLGDKNFTLHMDSSLESPTVPPGVAAQKTVAMLSAESKVKGQVSVKRIGLFYDAPSGILNKGPYPPRANQKTQFTVHWQVANFSTDVSNAVVKATLAPGVAFTGQTKSTIDAKPEFNSATGEITWNVGTVQATKGVISAPIEAVFQIEVTPSNLQVNQLVPLLGQTTVTAQDTFTNANLSATVDGLDTGLPDETKVANQNRVVLP